VTSDLKHENQCCKKRGVHYRKSDLRFEAWKPLFSKEREFSLEGCDLWFEA
jgi:hypothetical protein